MAETNEFYWLAGLLEGEGCFHMNSSPNVSVSTTDRDVLERAACLMGSKVRGPFDTGHKPIWSASLSGDRALDLMRRLLPLMGQRRTAKIQEVITNAEKRPGHLLGKRRTKLNSTAIQVIRWLVDSGVSSLRVAKAYSICPETVRRAGLRKTWRHVPEH